MKIGSHFIISLVNSISLLLRVFCNPHQWGFTGGDKRLQQHLKSGHYVQRDSPTKAGASGDEAARQLHIRHFHFHTRNGE